MKRVRSTVLAVVLMVVLVASTRANDDVVRWTVAESTLYTVVHNNSARPAIQFNDCLVAGQTYTLDFAVTVQITETYDAQFSAADEGARVFMPQMFDPSSVRGTGPQTFQVRGTFRVGDSAYHDLDGVAIALATSDTFLGVLGVRWPCVAQHGLPESGANSMLDVAVRVGLLTAGLTLLGVGAATRGRTTVDERAHQSGNHSRG